MRKSDVVYTMWNRHSNVDVGVHVYAVEFTTKLGVNILLYRQDQCRTCCWQSLLEIQGGIAAVGLYVTWVT